MATFSWNVRSTWRISSFVPPIDTCARAMSEIRSPRDPLSRARFALERQHLRFQRDALHQELAQSGQFLFDEPDLLLKRFLLRRKPGDFLFVPGDALAQNILLPEKRGAPRREQKFLRPHHLRDRPVGASRAQIGRKNQRIRAVPLRLEPRFEDARGIERRLQHAKRRIGRGTRQGAAALVRVRPGLRLSPGSL
ncbi:MAG: hypothetical protein ACXW3R_13050 [Rhodoplanes sp.]